MNLNFIGQLKFIKLFPFFLIIFLQSYSLNSFAQCGITINSFPYNEGFETSPAWTNGGTNDDWEWGTPSHPTISSAGGGSKSWCVGGLTGSSYSGSAQSYLMSPCFDFTSLNYPWISFKIFWETEFKFDGLVLQYSLNGGTTWTNVGAYNDPVDCLNDNWFNYNNITWLTSASPKHGWSGRLGLTSGSCQGGNGSGGWVNAKHCMSALANKPSVRFRFLFGSGTTCNAFDGVAIDDILIKDADPNTANFSYTCTGVNTVDFLNSSDICSTDYLWNFGDPASGASNTSTAANPTHTFSGPGNYTVTLTSNGPCNAPGIQTQTISILSNSISPTNVSCFGGNNGTATAMATSGSPITYTWNTVPVQTTITATGLATGTYTVSMTSATSCPTTATIIITEPTQLISSVTSSAACNTVCNGSVGITAAGGTPPYTYAWSVLGAGQDFIGTVCTGTYTGSVMDDNGCTAMSTALVDSLQSPQIFCDSAAVCIGSNAILTATGALSYVWSPSTGLSATTGSTVWANPTATTTYTLTGINAAGCSGTTTVTVYVDDVVAPHAEFSFNPLYPDVFNPEVNFINLTTGGDTYEWNFGNIDFSTETNPNYSFPVDSGGSYAVCLIANNYLGCADTICHEVFVNGFTSVYIPNAFTPNGDGSNETFYPVLRDVSREGYEFRIFDRWGQIIFMSNSLESQWDGTFKGINCKDGVYVWKIKYTEESNGTNRTITGHFSLLR
jgi:gliding motility-associated-like protein